MPRLDFGDWYVLFPVKGHHEFLSADSLRETRPHVPDSCPPGLWMSRTESGICVVLPVKLEFRRESLRPVHIAVLHHGDNLHFAGHDVRFYEIQRARLGLTVQSAKHRCLQCRTRLVSGDIVVQCPLCNGLYCDDCWAFLELRRCYSRGCRYSPTRLDEVGNAS